MLTALKSLVGDFFAGHPSSHKRLVSGERHDIGLGHQHLTLGSDVLVSLITSNSTRAHFSVMVDYRLVSRCESCCCKLIHIRISSNDDELGLVPVRDTRKQYTGIQTFPDRSVLRVDL